MNVFELTHQVNDRLNGGDESKFDMMFIIINEILFTFTLVSRDISFEMEMISEGNFDDIIMETIELSVDDIELEDKLSMIDYFHEVFESFRYGFLNS